MKAVRSIQYIAAVTRPDIPYAAHTLARHMAGSASKHWLAVLHVMRYLQSTTDVVFVVIHASAGVATSAQAMAWCMGGSLFVCVCSHALGIFSDPPSICGDSDLRCFIDFV